MKQKLEIWAIIVLEILFGLCALSVILYRILGIAFDFGFLSYRVFNIVFSILFIIYLVYALLKSHKYALILALLFSAFHFIEGILIGFWIKTVVHGFVIVAIGVYFYRHKTVLLKEK